MAVHQPETREQDQAKRYLIALYNNKNMYSDRPTRPIIILRPDIVTDFRVSASAPTLTPQLVSYYGHLETKTDEVEFLISKEQYLYFQDLLCFGIHNMIPAPSHLIPKQGAQPGVQVPIPTAPMSRFSFRQSEPKLRLMQVPAMVDIDFDEFGPDVTHYAFDCECTTEAGILCRHIPDAFLDAKDHLYWSRNHNISGLGKKFTIQVPIFKGVFYHVMLQKQSITTWDGEQVTKVFVKPMKGLLSERFVDLTYISILGDIRVEMLDHFGNLRLAALDSEMVACTARNHNYGTNKTLSEWLRGGFNSPLLDEDAFSSSIFEKLSPDFLKTRQGRYAATIFTRYVYGLCYVCYEHHNPMFSMSNI